jgi:hypothetical protein
VLSKQEEVEFLSRYPWHRRRSEQDAREEIGRLARWSLTLNDVHHVDEDP